MERIVETRMERVVLETSTHSIVGDLTLPAAGYRSRLSDFLNRGDVSFISLVNVELTPRVDGRRGETEQHQFMAVARDHVEIAYPAE